MKKAFSLALALLLVLCLLPAASARPSGYTVISRNNGQMEITRALRDPEIPMGDFGWTMLFYLCGTDLETDCGSATGDLAELLDAEWGPDVRVVIQTGGTEAWQNEVVESRCIQRYLMEDGELYLLETLPDAGMGDPDTLADFVRWGVQNYGAARMGLTLWNHGGGSISGVCFDETRDYESLSLADLDIALASVYPDMTDRFEFIGFDACLMATLETANVLAPYARYMYASQEVEPDTGWDYTALITWLSRHPDADGAALGKVQCSSYMDACSRKCGSTDRITFSIVDLEKLDPLILDLDLTAADLYNGASLSEVSRAGRSADNFGDNNRSEGYTNMIDLAGLLRSVSGMSGHAADALQSLEEAVIFSCAGAQHTGAGGLSVYFPLCVGGSSELSTFRDVCVSTYYLALCDRIAYGSSGQEVSIYDNSDLLEDTDSIWEIPYAPDDAIGSYSGSSGSADADACPIPIQAIYLDDDGKYTIRLRDMDALAYGSCTLFWELEVDGESYYLYLGEDDDVLTDTESCTITDDFDGSWVWLEDDLLPIELIAQYDDTSLYSVSILLNGEESYLRIAYDWDSGDFRVLGTWSGISQSGAAGREGPPLQDGDVIEILYYYTDADGETDFITSDPITISGEPALYYDSLAPGEYYYSIYLYDIYGGCWDTGEVVFGVDEDLELYFYESDDLTWQAPEGPGEACSYLDDNGSYFMVPEDPDAVSRGTCLVWYDISEDGSSMLFLGETDEIDLWSDGSATDCFDGSWLWLEDSLLPYDLIEVYDDCSVYASSVSLNGEDTYLCFLRNNYSGRLEILGTAEDADSSICRPLQKGDRLEICYCCLDEDGEYEYFYGDPIIVGSRLRISRDTLFPGEYHYAICLYADDGRSWTGDYVVFGVRDDGSLFFR